MKGFEVKNRNFEGSSTHFKMHYRLLIGGSLRDSLRHFNKKLERKGEKEEELN